jgi:hypothetical protein
MWWAYTRGGAYIRGEGLIFGGLIVGGLRYCMTIKSGTN